MTTAELQSDTTDSLSRDLAVFDPRYDPETRTIRAGAFGNGYHSLVPAGEDIGDIRSSFAYALLLLRAGRDERAIDILDTLIALQITDPTDEHYGIWPWYLEESVKQMAPADYNWADFCGLRLAEVYREAGDWLPPEVKARVADAIRHAAWAIFRRNVRPGYTNIAIKGGVVCAFAGEAFGEPALLEYGRRRLARVVSHGEFTEYNSPTYAIVSLDVCERGLVLLKDEASRQSVQQLWRSLWEMIAKHYHVPTRQWAGPHSRAYRDTLNGSQIEFLARRISAWEVPPREDAGNQTESMPSDFGPAVLCPQDLVSYFTEARDAEWNEQLVCQKPHMDPVNGHVWMKGHACLATADWSYTWIQRRSCIGYFGAPDSLSVLTCQLLKDGRPWASGWTRFLQDGPNVLGAFGFITNGGDHHLRLDADPDGVYRASDIRLRFQLQGPEASATNPQPEVYRLETNSIRIDFRAGPGRLMGEAMQPESHTQGDAACVDLVLYNGHPRDFSLRKTDEAFGSFVFALSNESTPSIAHATTPQPPELEPTREDEYTLRHTQFRGQTLVFSPRPVKWR